MKHISENIAAADDGHCHVASAGHAHGGCHHHAVSEHATGVRLLLTLSLNFIIPVVQIIGGLAAHSVALISDATHNFSDFMAILVSYIAHRIGKKGASLRNTFGYRRAEILAALLNVVILTGASAVIVFEALQRFRHPETVFGGVVMGIAAVGVAGNGFSAWLLHQDARGSLNIRGAFLHMIGDMLTSVAVMVNGWILMYKPWYWLDPLLSVLIVLFVLKNCWSLLKESTAILMNATPRDLDIQAVQKVLESFPEISGVHYLHAWNLGSSNIAFSCHVVVKDQPVSQTHKLQKTIAHTLFHEFGIDHPVLQFETSACGNGNLFCEEICALPPSNPDEASHSAMVDTPWFRRLALAARLVLAGIFLYACADKIRHPAAFAEAVFNYQILPSQLVNLAALTIPWLELALGLLLLAGIWLPGALMGSSLLLTVFLAALAFNTVRGLNISCGCFSTEETAASALSWWIVLRDVFFWMLSVSLMCCHIFNGHIQNKMQHLLPEMEKQ
jgi:cation diffusion facilitator family transporter